jgi:peptide/nickel transport system substrate-binding protein
MRARLPLRIAPAAVALLALAFVSGSGAVSASSRAGAQAGPVPLIRVGIPHPVNTLDISKDLSSLPYVAGMGLEPLRQVNRQGKFVGVLAQRVTQPGRRTYVYHLRKGVRFWNGAELTSADVVNALNYYRASPSQIAYLFKSVNTIRALDRYRVAVTLKRPDVSFQFNIATTLVPIFQKRFQDANKATMGKPRTLIMGTGPWKFDSLDPTKGAEMSAWSGYWGPKPQIRRLSFRFFSDVTSMALAFRAGALDLVPEIEDARSWRRTTGRNPVVRPGCQIQMFGMPTTTPPWNDVNVRRAVAYALNRTEQIQAKGTPATPVTTLILPVQLYRLAPKAKVDAMIKSLPQYPYDLSKARAELAKSAYPNGFSFSFPTVRAFFGNDPQVVAAQLARIGINLDVRDVPFSEWIDHIVVKKDIPSLTWATCPTGDASDYVTNYLESRNISNYQRPAVNAMIQQSVFYANPARRFEVYSRLLRRLALDVPFVPLFSQHTVMAISSNFTWPTFGPGWLLRNYVAEIRPKK